MAGLRAEVCKWDANATAECVALCVTIGARVHPMPGREPGGAADMA